VNGLQSEFEQDVTFVRLNAAESDVEALQQQLALRGHPSLAILDGDGQVIQRYFGAQSAETLRPILLSLISPP
jgi:hypothetical protein